MIRLARNDTTTVIPSRDDRDEVGAMARAVEVFKDNAIQLIAREVELKQLNRRVDIALNNMTHGLCMFDAEQKLIVCNKTYVQMYALTPELSQAGDAAPGDRELSRERSATAPLPIRSRWRRRPRSTPARPPPSPRS